MRIGKSGQMMLIVVLIMVVLVISIATIVFLNQANAKFGVLNRNSQQASANAEAGLDYAVHVLSNPIPPSTASTTTWYNALHGQYPPEFFDAASPVVGSGLHLYNPAMSNTAYTISCSSSDLNTFSVYQLRVIVKSYTNQRGTWAPNRAISALISQKTLAVNLNDGTSASLAMQFTNKVPAANWTSHLAPIASYDRDPTHVLTLVGPTDSGRYPRKYAEQGITGTTFARSEPQSANKPTSDGQEFWAYSSLGNPPEIDLGSYAFAAQNMSFGAANAPVSKLSGNPLPAASCIIANCAYFQPPAGDAAVFKNGYSYQQAGTIIYINGDAEIDDAFIDLKGDNAASVFPSSGALIVTGNLAVNTIAGGGQTINFLRFPPSAPMEYVIHNGTLRVPCCAIGTFDPATCVTMPTSYCASNAGGPSNPNTLSGIVNFRGFLYVAGDMTYQWNLTGALHTDFVGTARVDGLFTTFDSNGSPHFAFYYDDEINHSIMTDTLQLQIDSYKPISAS